ncbi:transcript variant X2 [Nothobranchius furzeri]|uniref:Solute carrier family 41 member n=1 Tax=Nothobranchius furzeri TaxID=105023 RepID=A0A9D2YR80_NOTFU|nr:transcript variant X2 [Nothobranchius furzeri]
MAVPKSSDKNLSLTHGQQYGSNPALSQLSGRLQLSNSNGNLSPDSVTPVSQEFTESDALLPRKLSGSRPKDAEGSGGHEESMCSLLRQILLPFLLAGLGTVSAGILLEIVQGWDVFQEFTELFILVPAVLGMKGNLEMTLAARLSTAVNAGRMDSTREKWMLIVGNLALKQLQATVLGLLASLVVTLLDWIAEGRMPLNHLVLLCSTSLCAAFMASLLQELYPYVLYLVDLLHICLIPVWMRVASKHPESHILLRSGWEPIITAMVISSVGRLILDKTVSDENLVGIVVYAPVINGVGGNLVSIQASRISTHLHLNYSPREIPDSHKSCFNLCHTFVGTGSNQRSARVLLLLVLPGQLIFLHIIHLMKGGLTLPSPLFIVFFLSISLIQVFSLLCIADWMVHCLWQRSKDPDSYSIPYLTALGDLLGTALLSLSFLLLWCIGDPGGV